MEKRKTVTSSTVKARWNRRHYDRLTILFPKGYKEQLCEFAKKHGLSVNTVINLAAREILGVPEEEWKPLYVDPE